MWNCVADGQDGQGVEKEKRGERITRVEDGGGWREREYKV